LDKIAELRAGQGISYMSYVELLGSNNTLFVSLSESITEREIALYFLEI
jgi:hypothetical protein